MTQDGKTCQDAKWKFPPEQKIHKTMPTFGIMNLRSFDESQTKARLCGLASLKKKMRHLIYRKDSCYMDKYKVILVDDEEEVIDVIERKIHWDMLGFDVVGSANNGVKALELVEKLQPDVVITDIKMPYMDGLELSRRLNNDYQNIHIIIFTGFDEFEYAKEAVHLEIEEYMLKPINALELSDCLKRVKNSLDKEREEKLNVEKLANYFNASLPVLQTNLFVSLIEGRVSESDYEKFLAAYQIDMKGPLYCCAVFHTSEHHVPDGMNPLLLSMSVEQQIKDRIADTWKCKVFTYLGNTVLIIEIASEDAMAELTDACDRFCRWAYRVMGAVVTAGIGRVCDSLLNINNSYEGAREAVSYRVLYGTQRAINIAEIAPKEQKAAVQYEDANMHELIKSIYLGKRDAIEGAVHDEIDKLHRSAQTMNRYKLTLMEMVGTFYRFCANNFIDFDNFSGGISNPYEKVPEMDEVTLTAWLIDTSMAIGEELKNARNNTSRRMVTDAQNMVVDRYMEPDLSLDTVCSELGVSNSYFSSVFKKETGKSFISYLTDYRMDHAANLILETNEKSYKIAEQVGYQDANYFSYVFKKRFGMSPSKYRTEHTGNQ